MARRSSSPIISPIFSVFFPRGDTRLYLIAAVSVFSLLLHHLSLASASQHRHFEGFDADEADEFLDPNDGSLSDLDLPPPPTTTTLSVSDPIESHHGPPVSEPHIVAPSDQKPSSASFDYWDEDEFEGIPQHVHFESLTETVGDSESDPNSNASSGSESPPTIDSKSLSSYTVEIVCVSFLIVFVINYFAGKRENENIALAWATKYATKDSIFEKNFSLLGVGETDDSPLLLKEGQNVFKFYASGRRYCQGLLATMELKSRHDLISKLYNLVVPCKDEITFEVYMNDDAMDHVVFAVARKKLAKTMQKEVRDLQRYAGVVAPPAGGGRKWVADELVVVSESKEVAGDMITEVVLEQVFGEKAFEKFREGFISMHFSDQHIGSHKKMLVFKFALPNANDMADMTRLIALVPYYIDLIGKYKLSSHARSKAEVARLKVAQEFYKELQNARQEALQRKKAEQRKKLEEAEAKLSAEAIRKKEAKDRARQLKKGMPKMKMTRAH
ncbi:unnamed protein product [Cuscuta campestris]|uniref:DUF1682 domain-containing protein n=1 Tax=Cuscuta campestris TaxID=132261 RepID=A0A484MLD8_9ASTE|nr:unnamed protein product [Cuscuta campestris]